MTTTFTYPTSAELMVIERDKIPRLTQNRPIFEIFPMKNVDKATLIYEQLDNIIGLQQARGLNGSPRSVPKRGRSQKQLVVGVYGEFQTIDELELTVERRLGTFNEPISLDQPVMLAQETLLERRLNQIERIGWSVLATGSYTTLGSVGQVLASDSFAIQTANAAITWATHSTSTPLADLRSVQLLSRGHSVSFGREAKAFLNRATFNDMLSNTNANDLGGKRTYGLASITGLDDINVVLAGDDLPQLVIYDQTYFDEAGATQLYIPNNKVIVVGKRETGVPLGNYVMLRNANNPDLAPGPYMKIIDNGERAVPREIQVHDGHNGGPAIYLPSGVAVLTI